MQERHSESASETVIEDHLLANGYVSITRDGFDRDRAIFPELTGEGQDQTLRGRRRLDFPGDSGALAVRDV